MKMYRLLLTVLLMTTACVDASDRNFLYIYDLLGVDYRVEEGGFVEGIGEVQGVYNAEDDTIVVREQFPGELDAEYLHLILHELVHWTGFREGRSPRDPYLGVIIEEGVAEVAATWLSFDLYGGELGYTWKEVYEYLRHHPYARTINDAERKVATQQAKQAYRFLKKELKRLDVENELGLQ